MLDSNFAPSGASRQEDEIDVRRYLGAVRRSVPLIAAITLILLVVVLGISLLLPKQYTATSRIVLQQPTAVLGSTDSTSVERELATADVLLTSSTVLDAAGKQVPRSTSSELESAISSVVDQSANIITVQAVSTSGRRAAQIANAVSVAFIARQTTAAQTGIDKAQAALREELVALQGRGGTAAEVRAVQQRLSELTVSRASAGSDLQVAQAATAPTAPSSPRPLRNAILALVAGLFLGVVVALVRDLLKPRISSMREYARLSRQRVLAAVPYVRPGIGRRRLALSSAAEEEAYHTLRTWMELELSGEDTHLILVTSAVHGEGKTTVTAQLGRALAESGYDVLLMSADLRQPKLHLLFGVEEEEGLRDILTDLRRGVPTAEVKTRLEHAVQPVELASQNDRLPGRLGVLTSGSASAELSRNLSSDDFSQVFDMVRDLGYRYVLVDGPPLLGVADTTLILADVDEALLVARFDRLTVEQVIDTREMLSRATARQLGVVVIGARHQASPYYLPRRTTPAPAPSARD